MIDEKKAERIKDNDGTFVILWFPIFCLPTIISIVAVINDLI